MVQPAVHAGPRPLTRNSVPDRATPLAPGRARPRPTPYASRDTLEPSHAGHTTRIRSLDGLRGLAALIVLFNHAIITAFRALSLQDNTPTTRLHVASVSWWLAFTPLHVIYDGFGSVVIFFVLSGYVLALPAVKLGSRWLDVSYYPRRIVRLYVPVWGALVLATLWHLAKARHAVAGGTIFLNEHAVPLTLIQGLGGAALVHQNGAPAFIPPLWSLRWEVYFSLLLPLFLLFPLMTRRRPGVALAGGVAALAVIAEGTFSNQLFFRYMPMFLLGSLLAFHQDRIRALAVTLRRRLGRPGWGVGLPLVTISLLTADNWCFAFGTRHAIAATALATALVSVGACLAVFLAAHLRPFTHGLSSAPGRWLGTRSYSLYLVHEPMLITVAYLMGGRPNGAVFLIVVIPAALLLAELFYRAVEAPAIRLARWTGGVAQRQLIKRRIPPRLRPANRMSA